MCWTGRIRSQAKTTRVHAISARAKVLYVCVSVRISKSAHNRAIRPCHPNSPSLSFALILPRENACVFVCVFIELHTKTTQCGPITLVILYCLYWSSQGVINDTYDKRGYACVCVWCFMSVATTFCCLGANHVRLPILLLVSASV